MAVYFTQFLVIIEHRCFTR